MLSLRLSLLKENKLPPFIGTVFCFFFAHVSPLFPSEAFGSLTYLIILIQLNFFLELIFIYCGLLFFIHLFPTAESKAAETSEICVLYLQTAAVAAAGGSGDVVMMYVLKNYTGRELSILLHFNFYALNNSHVYLNKDQINNGS